MKKGRFVVLPFRTGAVVAALTALAEPSLASPIAPTVHEDGVVVRPDVANFGERVAVDDERALVSALIPDPARNRVRRLLAYERRVDIGWTPAGELPFPQPAAPLPRVDFGLRFTLTGDRAFVTAPLVNGQNPPDGVLYAYRRDPGGWVVDAMFTRGPAGGDDLYALTGVGVGAGARFAWIVKKEQSTSVAERFELIAGKWTSRGIQNGTLSAFDETTLTLLLSSAGTVRVLRATPPAPDTYVEKAALTVTGHEVYPGVSGGFGAASAGRGDLVAVTAPGTATDPRGAVYLFRPTDGTFIRALIPPAGRSFFGVSVAITDDVIAIADAGGGTPGACSPECPPLPNPAQVYFYARNGLGLLKTATLTGATTSTGTKEVSTGAIDAPVLSGSARALGVAHGPTVRFYRFALGNGATCAAALTCLSGHCIDGVCCDTACGAGHPRDCEACSIAAGTSAEGTCGPVRASAACGDPPIDAECDEPEICDGKRLACPADLARADGTSCAKGKCFSGRCTAQAASKNLAALDDRVPEDPTISGCSTSGSSHVAGGLALVAVVFGASRRRRRR